MRDVDASWLACAYDSEGTITIGKHIKNGKTVYYPSMAISNTNLDYIKHVKELMNYDKVNICMKDSKMLNRAKVYSLAICGQDCIYERLTDIMPFLIIKKQRAQEVLKLIESKRANNKFEYDLKHFDCFSRISGSKGAAVRDANRVIVRKHFNIIKVGKGNRSTSTEQRRINALKTTKNDYLKGNRRRHKDKDQE